jgi:hypothetical protein
MMHLCDGVEVDFVDHHGPVLFQQGKEVPAYPPGRSGSYYTYAHIYCTASPPMRTSTASTCKYGRTKGIEGHRRASPGRGAPVGRMIRLERHLNRGNSVVSKGIHDEAGLSLDGEG